MNEFRTKFKRLQSDIRRLKQDLVIYQQAARSKDDVISDLAIENRMLREDIGCLKQSLEWRDAVIADLRRKLEQAAKEADNV